MELLRETMLQAKRVRELQRSEYEKYLKQVAQQINFLQRQGIQKLLLRIPSTLNGVPIPQAKFQKKLYKTLRELEYKVQAFDDHALEISWDMSNV
jgi:flagellar hook-length control protein FliK